MGSNWHLNYAKANFSFAPELFGSPPSHRGLLAQSLADSEVWISNDPGVPAGFGSYWHTGILVGFAVWIGFAGSTLSATFPYGLAVNNVPFPP